MHNRGTQASSHRRISSQVSWLLTVAFKSNYSNLVLNQSRLNLDTHHRESFPFTSDSIMDGIKLVQLVPKSCENLREDDFRINEFSTFWHERLEGFLKKTWDEK